MKKKIAIIGAGPAGLSSAINLAESDKSFEIHLFEKDRVGDNIICAEGFFDFFNTINLELPEKMKVSKIILSHNSKTEITLPRNSNIFTFDRKIWQKNLAEKALSSGVKIFENTKIKKEELKKLCKEYNYVLDCSGFYGVSHYLFPERDIKRYRKGLVPAIQYELQGDFSLFNEKIYTKIFDNPPGYFWLFPKIVDGKVLKANAGLGILLKKRENVKIKDKLEKIINDELSHYKKIRYSASPIPTKRLKTYRKNNIILLGDALGLCSPLHGGGIDSAYLSGYYVAKSIMNDDFTHYESFLYALDRRFLKERFILKLWDICGSEWLIKRLRNKGLFSEDIKLHPFTGKWLSKAILKLFF